jgi:mono/diheme cytochrome c family protein
MKLGFFQFFLRNRTFANPAAAILLFLLLSIFFFLSCQPLDGPKTDLSPPSGAELFQSKCSQCHDPELALNKYRSEVVWRDTITRMKEQHKADISRQEIELLVKYHIDRQQKETAIFKEKCTQCHPGKVFLEKNLTPEQARSIIRRMQQLAGNTIEDTDVEMIVRYHVQAQQAAGINLQGISDQILQDQPEMKRGAALFVEKCSACHNPNRAFSVIKDPEVWAQTLKRMQTYSKGAITDDQAAEIVNFHVTQQQRELNTFQETCSKCHDDERINSRSMSDEQWLATIKRMQQKAPELITDEKVTVLAAYFHRRELALARIFYGKCKLCHFDISGKALSSDSVKQLDGLIVLASEEFERSLELPDIYTFLSIHSQRQKRNMQLYEDNCTTCHPGGSLEEKRPDQEKPGKRSRAEWISFIAALQGVELTKEIQNTINSQVEYHVSRY